MISDKHKCIFIHVPKTAGESIETALMGRPNWEKDDPNYASLNLPEDSKIGEDKHYTVSQWKDHMCFDSYFKFSFVRNPWARTASLQKYSKHFGVSLQKGKINFGRYFDNFYPLEIDHRSKSHEDSFDPIENAIYLNILNVKLDFIGKFENLQQDFNIVCDQIGISHQKLVHAEQSTGKNYNKHYTEYYDDETRQIVAEKYAKDIEYFGYNFGE